MILHENGLTDAAVIVADLLSIIGCIFERATMLGERMSISLSHVVQKEAVEKLKLANVEAKAGNTEGGGVEGLTQSKLTSGLY